MNKKNLSKFSKLAGEVKKLLESESSGHDFHHALRVFNTAMHLQKHEGGDIDVIGASALVHDICRPWEKKTGKSHFGDEALEIIRGVLIRSGVRKEKIDQILNVVALHDVYDWKNKIKNKSIELQIVQDADNLDAIGAIGIARTFSFSGANGIPMYNPEEKSDVENDFVDDPNNRTSSITHFYEKLLRLKENMNTAEGKILAEKRHEIMEKFLKDFFDEWNSNFS